MGIGDRSDGVRLRRLPGFRKMFPYLMRTRTESVVYHSQRLRIGKTLAWLDKANAAREKKISLFHVVLAAGVRTLALRPEANRFVVGRRIFQRRTIDLSFVVKRGLSEEATETTVKITFDPHSTIVGVVERVTSVVKETRQSSTSRDEGTAAIVTRLPRSLIRLATRAIRTLDYFGLLPASFIKGDALYTSVFLANLGSIGADAVFHHLYEWGNASYFVTVGRRKKEPVVNERGELEVAEVIDLKFSLDERISDGVYFRATINLLTDLIENPEKLDVPPEFIPDPFALR
jgi:pyruvate/2-oxoglutarate dehydrogenase complex dihydrolipoamide acyltransferase (E2) component